MLEVQGGLQRLGDEARRPRQGGAGVTDECFGCRLGHPSDASTHNEVCRPRFKKLSIHQRDGSQFIEITGEDFYRLQDLSQRYASTEGGSTYRLGQHLLSAESGDPWRFYICKDFFKEVPKAESPPEVVRQTSYVTGTSYLTGAGTCLLGAVATLCQITDDRDLEQEYLEQSYAYEKIRKAYDDITHGTDGPVTRFVAIMRTLDAVIAGKDREAYGNALEEWLAEREVELENER